MIAPIRIAAQETELQDSYRLILLHGSGADVFLRADKDGRHSLPEIQISKFTRTLAQITAKVHANWGIATTLLFSNAIPSAVSERFVAVLETPRECAELPELVRHPIRNAGARLRSDEAALLESCCARVLNQHDSSHAAPFARLGWIYTVQDWVQEAAGPIKITSFCQLGGSDDTCLVQFETSARTLWYKAVGHSNPREFAITSALSQWLPEFLPRVIAFDSTLNAWLMESGGNPLLRTAAFGPWEQVVRRLSALQMASTQYASELLKIGCIDGRTKTLQISITPFFEFIANLMRRQVKNPPAPLTLVELSDVAEILRSALSEVLELGIPDVIGHSDFNPGNILIEGDRTVFIDWLSAHVGSPVLTLEYLIAHFRRNCAFLPGHARVMRQAYQERWLSMVPQSAMSRILELGPLIGVYAIAVGSDSWRDPGRLGHPGVCGYLRSLARIMKREAEALIQQGSLKDGRPLRCY